MSEVVIIIYIVGAIFVAFLIVYFLGVIGYNLKVIAKEFIKLNHHLNEPVNSLEEV